MPAKKKAIKKSSKKITRVVSKGKKNVCEFC